MKVQTLSIEREPLANAPDCKALFMGFMKLGLMGFGGVLPLAHRIIVEEHNWLDESQFTDLLGVCQLLPGGNIINMSVAIGMEFQGIKGAISSVLGLISAPTAIVLILYQVYEYFQYLPVVKHMIQGLAAAAAGLLFATGLKMLRPILKSYLTFFTILLTFVFMLWIKLPLALTLAFLLTMNMLVLGVKKS
ncbi:MULTISPECIES: chromate transporter [unclassified Acinetobacter]|uniref:chromate transporter n=1 Tax=unclassified Acinetobacter TaxID=196816 RepID=UPI0024472962|nr:MULTISPECIES: chromate transporter [unclassified Acinetobacter]MDH0030627.1 chromate transporter [Acinetobacter sp. GD04021]MDH0886262.1 chromate transporter [Acinetobacter sp. GD03873]MDH1081763.1 chromate transporter [Acinetobacter sp. GD03983]MDH2189739.1 chromate transporter [Acinetobacter sp. GD03645]MDH2202731.1 chromate transporter [Acinetobacter sp. GD03647]